MGKEFGLSHLVVDGVQEQSREEDSWPKDGETVKEIS